MSKGSSKILIIDDYKWASYLLAAELMDEGFEVTSCEQVAQLLETIGATHPDLVVMEARLGDVDGLEVVQQIRNLFYDLPVVLWTARYDVREDLRSMAADYVVLKSSNMDELKGKINRALETASAVGAAGHWPLPQVLDQSALPL